jgi:DNA-directed RNA polymerase subunit K/omega
MDEDFIEEEFDDEINEIEEEDDIESEEEEIEDDESVEQDDEDIDFDDNLCDEIDLISNLDTEIEDVVKTKYLIENQEKKSRNIMTPYEKCRILGLREKQLIDGSLPMVNTQDCNNEKDIAHKELKEGKIPFIIVRTLPNNIREYWRVSELLIIN